MFINERQTPLRPEGCSGWRCCCRKSRLEVERGDAEVEQQQQRPAPDNRLGGDRQIVVEEQPRHVLQDVHVGQGTDFTLMMATAPKS